VKTAFGALLNEGVLAEGSISEDTMRKKWAKIQRAPETMEQRRAEKTWPKAATAVVSGTGENWEKYQGIDKWV